MMTRLTRHSVFLLILACTLAASGCAPGARTAAQPQPPQVLEQIPWTRFVWASTTIGDSTFPKAAIYLPFTSDTLGGATYWLQLDTGADVGLWLYRAPLRQLLARQGTVHDWANQMEINGRVGSYQLRQVPVDWRNYEGDTIAAGETAAKVGTLGLSFFRDKVLLLDLPRQRFAIVDRGAHFPAWMSRRIAWTPVRFRDEKLFVPLTMNGFTFDDFFYDSGASLFAVSATEEVWRAATGRMGDEPDNVVRRVASFGQEVVLVGAPAKGRVAVGQAAVDRPVVFHVRSGPQSIRFEHWGFRVSGLFGNALFADQYTLIIDIPRLRFGLLEGPLP